MTLGKDDMQFDYKLQDQKLQKVKEKKDIRSHHRWSINLFEPHQWESEQSNQYFGLLRRHSKAFTIKRSFIYIKHW